MQHKMLSLILSVTQGYSSQGGPWPRAPACPGTQPQPSPLSPHVPEGTGPTVTRMANLGSEFSGPSEDPYHSEQSKCLIVPPRSPQNMAEKTD